LLASPVEFEGAEGLELREDCVEDDEVDVVAEVGPDADEEAEVGDRDGGVEVIEGFGGLSRGVSVVICSWGRRKGSGGGGKGKGTGKVWSRWIGGLTARKKSLMSWVIYTASPIYVK
jgi:hypothetical protein